MYLQFWAGRCHHHSNLKQKNMTKKYRNLILHTPVNCSLQIPWGKQGLFTREVMLGTLQGLGWVGRGRNNSTTAPKATLRTHNKQKIRSAKDLYYKPTWKKHNNMTLQQQEVYIPTRGAGVLSTFVYCALKECLESKPDLLPFNVTLR